MYHVSTSSMNRSLRQDPESIWIRAVDQAWSDFSDWSDKSNNFPPAPALIEVTALCESKPCTLKRPKDGKIRQRTATNSNARRIQPISGPLSAIPSLPSHLGGLSGLSPSLGQTEQPNVVQSRSKGLVRIYKPSNALQTDIGFLRLNERVMYIDESHGIEEMLVKPFRQNKPGWGMVQKIQTSMRYSFHPAPCIIASQRQQPPYQHWVSERSRWDVAGTFCWCLRTSCLRVHSVNRYFQCIQSKSDQCFLNSESIEYNLTTSYNILQPYTQELHLCDGSGRYWLQFRPDRRTDFTQQ